MTQGSDNEEGSNFDTIFTTIGNNGLFQKRYIWIFNFVLITVVAITSIDKIISLNVPDHWCHVPGREDTNYTLEEWKQLTIPMEVYSNGMSKYSQCRRFEHSGIQIDGVMGKKIIKCDQGWEYDHTWYEMTTTMQNDWVCDNNIIPTRALSAIYVGDVLTSLIYGYVADNFGRLPVFYLSLSAVILSRIVSIYTSSWEYLFMFFYMLSAQVDSAIQSAVIIGVEVSRVENRALISMLMTLGASSGMILCPLLIWWLRNWMIFSIAATLPCAIFLFSRPWIIESPRWLVSRGKIQRCLSELTKIAKTNNTQLANDTEEHLTKMFKDQGDKKRNTFTGFFSSSRLVKNTIILAYCLAASRFISVCFTLNISNFSGNPFLNYTLLAIAEIPAFLIGKYCSDRFGRRWVTLVGFVFLTIIPFSLIYLIQDPDNMVIMNIMVILMKTNLSITHHSIYLQSLEIYPTCIRQTGVSIGLFFSNLLGIIAPYIIAFGVSVDISIPYYIYTGVSLVGGTCSWFLPETMGQKLPETLTDGASFRADQNFWGVSSTKHRKRVQNSLD